jgi:hypothetical protein
MTSGDITITAGWLVFSLILGIPPAVALARSATLLSSGVFRGRRSNVLFQTVVAAAAVFLTLAAVNYLIWRSDPVVLNYTSDNDIYVDPDLYFYRVKYVYKLLETSWACLPTLAVAAAASFATIEKKSPPTRPIAGRLGVAASFALIGLSASLLFFILTVGRGNIKRTVNLNYTFIRLGQIFRGGRP